MSPEREEVARYHFRRLAIWLVGLLVIGIALRALFELSWDGSQSITLPSLVLSAGLIWLIGGTSWLGSLKTDRERVADILESL